MPNKRFILVKYDKVGFTLIFKNYFFFNNWWKCRFSWSEMTVIILNSKFSNWLNFNQSLWKSLFHFDILIDFMIYQGDIMVYFLNLHFNISFLLIYKILNMAKLPQMNRSFFDFSVRSYFVNHIFLNLLLFFIL